MMETFVLSVP